MEENKNQQQYFQMMGNATLFIIPFHYGEENENQSLFEGQQNFIVHEGDDSVWTLETQMLTDEKEGSVIYPYIMSFLQGQMMDEGNDVEGRLVIYSIADIDRRTNQESKFEQRTIIKKFWNKFSQSTHTVDVGTKDTPRILSFRFFNGKHKTLKPHLFIFPSARIGLLSFGIELTTPDATTDDLKNLNYSLHKIAKPIAKCVCNGLNITGDVDSEQRKFKEAAFNSARSFIEPHYLNKKDLSRNDNQDVMEFTWSMKTLIDTLLKDIRGIVYIDNKNDKKETPIELFTPPRIHIFTYCGIDDSENKLAQSNILPELYRLSRCVNDKYLLPFENTNFHESYFQTFENVYVSSTIEGTAFIALSKEQNAKFFEGFTGILALRYVWIYLLAMIQRYSLLNIDMMLTKLEADDAKDKNEHNNTSLEESNEKVKRHSAMLWRLLESIRNIKVRCHFTDISPFTQHNEFYEHCCDRLHVNIAYDEIDHKTKALSLTMGHDLQLLQEANDKEIKTREDRMNLFLAIFAVLQGISVLYELFDALLFKSDWKAVGLYSVLILVSVFIVYHLYKKHHVE